MELYCQAPLGLPKRTESGGAAEVSGYASLTRPKPNAFTVFPRGNAVLAAPRSAARVAPAYRVSMRLDRQPRWLSR
jgi:hypothetical protein